MTTRTPKDGGRYKRSVAKAKAGAKIIARKVEKQYKLPPNSVRIRLTQMTPGQREKIASRA